MPGHRGECRTAAALAHRRVRLTERRREKTLVTPEARSRWNRAYKLRLMGLTPERFAQMMETQGYACAMCHTPFEKEQRVCIDHDHACCPPKLPSRCCGECVRGLLCLTCNIALGYIESYSELAMAYLETAQRPASPQPVGRTGLAALRSGAATATRVRPASTASPAPDGTQRPFPDDPGCESLLCSPRSLLDLTQCLTRSTKDQHHRVQPFRARFHLRGWDRATAELNGPATIRHAGDLITKRLAPAEPYKDGEQTPTPGPRSLSPSTPAPPAAAPACCTGTRSQSRELTPEECAYVVDVIFRWIQREMTGPPGAE